MTTSTPKLNAQELRIGNWVNIIGRVPTKATTDHIKSIFEGDVDYKAIPLTPEILEKAGFVKTTQSGYVGYVLDDFEISATGGDGLYYSASNREETNNQPYVNLTYLHQLQNLYFALTGEELNIEL